MNTCGCLIIGVEAYYHNMQSGDKATLPEIIYCPLHGAAEELYKVCQLALRNEELVDDLRGSGMVDYPELKALRAIANAARTALATARRPEPADDSEMPLGLIEAPWSMRKELKS